MINEKGEKGGKAQIELQTKAAQGVADVSLGQKPADLVNQSVWKQVT